MPLATDIQMGPVDPLLPFPIGIELEMNDGGRGAGLASDRLARTLATVVETGQSRMRHVQVDNAWTVKPDGSCGWEVSSPPLRTFSQLGQITAVCQALTAAEVSVDIRCGLHVHVGINHLYRTGKEEEVMRLLKFFIRYQEAFFLLAGPTRGVLPAVKYCKRFTPEMRTALRADGLDAYTDRYWWMNGRSFNQHGTLEFRLMPGTLDGRFVTGWVSLLLTIFDTVALGGKSVCWGEANARDNRMLLYTMLQQAGCYGKDIRQPHLAVAAREWAGHRFNQLNPRSILG